MISAYDTVKKSRSAGRPLVHAFLLSRQRAAAALSVSVSTLDGLTASGQLASVRVGGRRLYRPADLQAFTDGLPVAERPGQGGSAVSALMKDGS